MTSAYSATINCRRTIEAGSTLATPCFTKGKRKVFHLLCFRHRQKVKTNMHGKLKLQRTVIVKMILKVVALKFMVRDFIVCFREFSFHVFAFMLKDYVTWYTLSTPRGGGHKKIYTGRLNRHHFISFLYF